jgi:uncharacterized protein (DUF427 family)
MEHSPGHREHPEHKVRELDITHSVEAEVNGEVLARSRHAIKVDEDENPNRYYFPRSDVNMKKLKQSATTSECPFKGTASYFDVIVHGHRYHDAAWSYEDPYVEHSHLTGMIAFYNENLPGLMIGTEEDAQEDAQKQASH